MILVIIALSFNGNLFVGEVFGISLNGVSNDKTEFGIGDINFSTIVLEILSSRIVRLCVA